MSQVVVGNTFTMTDNVDVVANALSTREIDANNITNRIGLCRRRSILHALSWISVCSIGSTVIYTTDLTAQYELGYNTVHDVNFSMETAHLAKNQILQQAATAMLAQANQGQQGLLQLIQG